MQPLTETLDLVAQPRVVTLLLAQGGPVPSQVPTVPVDLRRLIPAGMATASLEVPQGARLAPEEPGEVTISVRRRGVSPAR